MTEWEQMKREYREIEIPKDGPHQVMEAMAEAKRKRKRSKYLAGYGTIVAAALLILVLPGIQGTFSAENDTALNSASDSMTTTMTTMMTGTTESVVLDADGGTFNEAGGAVAEPESADTTTAASDLSFKKIQEDFLSDGELEKISQEIVRQMQESEENYFIKSEEYPDGFEGISEEQSYYINEAGQLVVVFKEGEVAPAFIGTVEFVIPREVYQVEERDE